MCKTTVTRFYLYHLVNVISVSYMGLFFPQSDTNECSQMSEDYPCDATNGQCENTDGSYFCTCDAGYQLETDGAHCIGIFISNFFFLISVLLIIQTVADKKYLLSK